MELLNAYVDARQESVQSRVRSRAAGSRNGGAGACGCPGTDAGRKPGDRGGDRTKADAVRGHHERGFVHGAGVRPDVAWDGGKLGRVADRTTVSGSGER